MDEGHQHERVRRHYVIVRRQRPPNVRFAMAAVQVLARQSSQTHRRDGKLRAIFPPPPPPPAHWTAMRHLAAP